MLSVFPKIDFQYWIFLSKFAIVYKYTSIARKNYQYNT